MRKICLAVLIALILGACSSTGPFFDRDPSMSFVCYPGSAIKRPVSSESAYPEWMVVKRGSCLRN